MLPEQGFLPGLDVERFPWPDARKIPTTCGWNPTVRYRLVQDEHALGQMLDVLARHDRDGWAWDTEDSGLKPELGARVCAHVFAVRTDERELTGYYVPIRHIGASNANEPQLPPEIVTNALRPLFAGGVGEVDTYHAKYDRKMSRADGLELRRPYCDIAIAATAFNENEPRFSLKALAEKYCTPQAKGEQEALEKWMRADAKRLGLSYKKHSKKKKAQLGLDAMTTPTYLERFGYSRAPIKLAGIYGIHDGIYTWWLSRVKYREVRQQFPELWAREHAVSDMLLDMEWHGLPVNEALIRDTHERTRVAVQHWLEKLRAVAPQFIDDSFEAGDSDLRRLFYEQLRMNPPKHTKKDNKPSADREARQILRRQYPQYAEIFHAVDQLAGDISSDGRSVPGLMKLHSTYAGNYLRYYSPVTKTINPSYNQLEQRDLGGVPVTGRLSSADPNNQNVTGATIHLWDCHCPKCITAETEEAKKTGRPPAKHEHSARMRALRNLPIENTVSVRRYFVVPEGYIRVYIDFSQIELRVLAWFCQDPNLLHAYRTGIDVHKLVAEQLGIARSIAKQVNFGNSYGMTEIGLALRMPGYYDNPERTREEAKKVLAAYFRQYPKILEFRRAFANEMRRNGCMFVNPFGRPRRIPDINASGEEKWKRERAERMMMSSIISGTAADLMKESMRRTWPIAQEVGGRMVQTIHDELVFDLPRRSGWAGTVLRLVDRMEDWPMFSESTPERQGVPIKVGVELSTTTWEGKKAIEILPDRTFRLAA